jgi:hypothetical protein
MPLSHTQLLILLGLPFAAAILVLGFGRLAGRRRAGGSDESESATHGATWPARLATPLAITLGPVLAVVIAPLLFKDSIVTLHLWPPRESRDWYLLATVVALLFGTAAVWMPRRFTALAVGVLGALLALRLSISGNNTVPVELWAALAAPGILYAILDPLARRNHNLAMPIILLLLAGSGVLVESDGTSPLHGFTCLPLPAALLGMIVAFALLSDRDLSRAALAAFLILWLAILFYGYFWTDVPWQRTLLLLFAPLAAYAADIPPIRRLRPFWRASLRVVLVAIPLAFAVVPAAKDLREQLNAPPQMQDM